MPDSDISLTSRERLRALATVVAVAAPTGAALTLIAPLAGLILDRAGHESWVVGLNAAATPLGVLIAAPLAPAIAARIGATIAMAGGAGLAAVAIALMTQFDDPETWFFLRLFIGVATAVPWAVSETLVNSLAGDRGRAFWAAAYGVAFAVGVALGPIVLDVVGAQSNTGFAVAAVIAALCAALLATAPRRPLRFEQPRPYGPLRAVWAAPVVIAAAFVSGYAETAALTFLDLALIDIDWMERDAIRAIAAFTAGAILLQWPLAWAAKRLGASRAAAAAGALILAGAIAFLPAAHYDANAVWMLAPVWGGLIFGLYVVGLVGLGDRFQGPELASANSAFIMAYMVGALLGPTTIGLLSGGCGEARGFALGIGAPALILLLFCVARVRR